MIATEYVESAMSRPSDGPSCVVMSAEEFLDDDRPNRFVLTRGKEAVAFDVTSREVIITRLGRVARHYVSLERGRKEYRRLLMAGFQPW